MVRSHRRILRKAPLSALEGSDNWRKPFTFSRPARWKDEKGSLCLGCLFVALTVSAAVIGDNSRVRSEWVHRTGRRIRGLCNAERCKHVAPRLTPPCALCFVRQRRIDGSARLELPQRVIAGGEAEPCEKRSTHEVTQAIHGEGERNAVHGVIGNGGHRLQPPEQILLGDPGTMDEPRPQVVEVLDVVEDRPAAVAFGPQQRSRPRPKTQAHTLGLVIAARENCLKGSSEIDDAVVVVTLLVRPGVVMEGDIERVATILSRFTTAASTKSLSAPIAGACSGANSMTRCMSKFGMPDFWNVRYSGLRSREMRVDAPATCHADS